jgi:hypothetical protein
MKYTTLLVALITFLLIASSCATAVQSPLPVQSSLPATHPQVNVPDDVIIPPKYTLEEVFAIAKKLSPECMVKKGESTGH